MNSLYLIEEDLFNFEIKHKSDNSMFLHFFHEKMKKKIYIFL